MENKDSTDQVPLVTGGGELRLAVAGVLRFHMPGSGHSMGTHLPALCGAQQGSRHVTVGRVEGPDADPLIPRSCGQQAICGKGHTVDGGTVEA